MCGFLNGTVKDSFLQKMIDDNSANNKVLKDLMHPCPYLGPMKVFVCMEMNKMIKSFVKGEYKTTVKLSNPEDSNILSMTIVNEGIEV